ncbi:MAG: CAP domain-containing protein [Longimicrobiales bacterium]
MTSNARGLLLLTFLAASTAGCMLGVPVDEPPPPAAARPLPASSAAAAAASEAAIARDVIVAGNAARARGDVAELASSPGANRAAMEYAQELANRHEIDHTSRVAGREDVGSRLQAAGVKWIRVGENLAMFSPRIGIAESSITGWLNSPGHRHNLLNPLYRLTGAGVARDERGYYYVVQIYATIAE